MRHPPLRRPRFVPRMAANAIETTHATITDITPILRALRRCRQAAHVGYVVGGIVGAGAVPAAVYGAPLYLFFVGVLVMASYAVTRGSRLGAALQNILVVTPFAFWLQGVHQLRRLIQPGGSSSFWDSELTPFLPIWVLLLSGVLYFTISGFIATIRLRTLRPSHQSVFRVAGAVERTSRKLLVLQSSRLASAAAYSLLAVLCYVPAVGPMVAMVAVGGVDEFFKLVPMWALIPWFLLLCAGASGGAYFLAKTKQLAALSALQIRKRDRRPPVLLLRSFQDDLTPVQAKPSYSRHLPPSFFHEKALTFEEVIERTLSAYGPVIAIGRPGEPLPPAGAAREYLLNAEWQTRVNEYIRESRLVVAILGKTEGLQFEYRALVDLRAVNKLIVLFPPVSAKERQARWGKFCEVIGIDAARWRPDELKDALLATFPENGDSRFVTCEGRDEECYQLALECGGSI